MKTLELKVRQLDSHTVNQIAAGEVVERPASVVKELVENALDAGATRIEVGLAGAGRDRIAVSDNGVGMVREDAELALRRHATSKIRSASDLGSVDTLGFRGEALPSIASVSRMSVLSGTGDGVRHRLVIEGGELVVEPTESGPRGTAVVVEDLFFNTPARLKFLKSDTTELNACVETVQRYALAFPEVSIRLEHGGQLVFQTSGDGDPFNALTEVWGPDVARAVIPLDAMIHGVRVRGFVSPPHFTKPTRAFQWFFVNRRPVRSRTLTASIDQAFRSLTPEKRYPVVVLCLDVEPSRLDINVSPTKSEVKFQAEGQVFDAVRHSVKSVLLEHGMVPDAASLAAANEALGFSGFGKASTYASADLLGQLFAQSPLQIPDRPHLFERGAILDAPGGSPTGVASSGPGAGVPFESGHSWAPSGGLADGLRIIGQAMNTFVLAENNAGILIVDQHVAHERILFEMLCRTRGSEPVESQTLLVPDTLELGPSGASLLAERLEDFREVGFDLEQFGPGSFLIRAVPAALKGAAPRDVLRDSIEALLDGVGATKPEAIRERVFITCSCKMAIKAGDRLTHAEMEKLLQDLAQTENPYLCPHGRPITIVLKRGDLLRKFKRC